VSDIKHLLIVRNDKLGDFMLAWPSLALLKHYAPELHITALVPTYTAPIARLCPWIDELLIDPQGDGLGATWRLYRLLRGGRFDAILTLFSTPQVGLAACWARIPYRLAPATKWVQICYPQRMVQRRSRSEKPEYAYNLDLAWRLLGHQGLARRPSYYAVQDPEDWLPIEVQRPLLRVEATRVSARRTAFCVEHGLNPRARLIFIHPGSGGSANNLSLGQYAELALALRHPEPLALVIHAGPGEEPQAEHLAAALGARAVAIARPEGGLEGMVERLAFADLFISGSTGPLHVAAALDRPTAAFYPRHRSATPLRWQTLNHPAKRLTFIPPPHAKADQVSAIEVVKAATRINQLLATL